jgi:hypothetical protein
MNYYVIAADGQKYGPANVDTLNQWAQEGRLQPTTILEDLTTNTRVQANQVAGINFSPPPSQNFQQPNYQQAPGPYMGDNGASDINMVWIFSALAFFCCPLIGIVAIVFASKAQQKGHPQGQTAMIVAILSLVLGSGVCCGLQGAIPAMGNFR